MGIMTVCHHYLVSEKQKMKQEMQLLVQTLDNLIYWLNNYANFNEIAQIHRNYCDVRLLTIDSHTLAKSIERNNTYFNMRPFIKDLHRIQECNNHIRALDSLMKYSQQSKSHSLTIQHIPYTEEIPHYHLH